MPRARKKRQHFVPQMHLKNFVGVSPKSMIWVYDVEQRSARPSKVCNVGHGTNFYSVRSPDGCWNDEIDDWLTEIESRASVPYADLLIGKMPMGEARSAVANFVATLYLRSPAVIRAAAAGYGHFVQLLMNAEWSTRARFEKSIDRFEKDTGRVVGERDEIWSYHTEKDRHVVSVDQKRGLTTLGAASKIASILMARRWNIERPSSGYFITGDCPVYRFVSDQFVSNVYGDCGFLNPAAEITLPLSPEHILIISSLPFGDGEVLLPADSVIMLNEMRSSAADRFLYAHEKSEEVSALGQKYKGPGLTMELSGGGPYAPVRVAARMPNKRGLE